VVHFACEGVLTHVKIYMISFTKPSVLSVNTYPNWLRGLEVLFGLVSLIVGVWVVLDLSLAQLTVLLLFSVTMILFGIGRLAKSFALSDLKMSSRLASFFAGIVFIIIAVATMLYPALAVSVMITMLAIAFCIAGLARLIYSGVEADKSGWWRGGQLVVGLATMMMAALIIIVPSLGFFTIVILLSISFVTNGMARIITGVRGMP